MVLVTPVRTPPPEWTFDLQYACFEALKSTPRHEAHEEKMSKDWKTIRLVSRVRAFREQNHE